MNSITAIFLVFLLLCLSRHPDGAAEGSRTGRISSCCVLALTLEALTALCFPLRVLLAEETLYPVFAVLIAFVLVLITRRHWRAVALDGDENGAYFEAAAACLSAALVSCSADYAALAAEFGFLNAYGRAMLITLVIGVGFGAALFIGEGLTERVRSAQPPAPFRGLPLGLVSLAIAALFFSGTVSLIDLLQG